MSKRLLVLGCSQNKRGTQKLPAFELYDGPYYRVLRKFLRDYQWPSDMSISTLSAEHGLFGVLKDIEAYDRRMDRSTAAAHSIQCEQVLKKWTTDHDSVHLALGRDYAPAIQPGLDNLDIIPEFFGGPIGMKLSQVKKFLHSQTPQRRERADTTPTSGPLKYFIPDWDDLLDPNFNFALDSFSGATRNQRGDRHCNELIRPTQMCDGILVSLAQRQHSKGPLRKLKGTEPGALAPTPLRQYFGMAKGQMLFGDCGAFSYVNESEPTISTEQAISLYELYHFDFGSSVDHMPIKSLPHWERQERVKTTCNNAEKFIVTWKERGELFTPVGSIQGINPKQYAENVSKYCEMGYQHLALGGLVPLRDGEITEIVESVCSAVNNMKQRPWLHLFGIFRPKLQGLFRKCGIDSFDSATYFRKAWLRSDQNYLGKDGKWYTAIRVPMTSDPRTRKRLIEADGDITELGLQEQRVLELISKFEMEQAGVNEVLEAVLAFDLNLQRSGDVKSMRDAYRRTLETRPWNQCPCTFCRKLGIHIVIFRGGNRNKRRGAHNTALLHEGIRAHAEQR